MAVISGSWVFLVAVLVILGGLVYGLFTRSGSAIDEHPLDARQEAPGAKGQSEVAGADQGEGSALDTHGTR